LLQRPGRRDVPFQAQVDRAVTGQPGAVGRVVVTVAGAIGGQPQLQRTEGAVHVQPAAVARAPWQQVAVGAGIAVVARVQVGQLAVAVEPGTRRVAGELHAADAGLVDVHQVGAAVVADHVLDPGLEQVHRPVPARALLGQAQVHAPGGLRLQGRVAEARVIEVVEGRRLEAGAGAGGQAQAVAQPHAVGEAAGGVVAELLVVVVAGTGLQRVCAKAALVLDEHAQVVARVHVERRAAVDAVVLPVGPAGQLLALRQGQVGLDAGRIPAGVELAGERAAAFAGEEVLRAVAGTAGLGRQLHAVASVPVQARAVHLLAVLGLVAAEDAAVVFVEAVHVQRVRFELGRVAQGHAAAEVVRGVAVAVAVRLVGEAAGAPAGGGAAAGIDAVGALARGAQGHPAALAALADAAGDLAVAIAADAGHGVVVEALGRRAGEHLDNAADRLRAVQARVRAAHDLDALDLLDRQALEGRHAGGGRADAHPVHQHQHLVGGGAAHEQRAELAQAALVAQVDAGTAAQQVLQRGGLAALDGCAVDDLDRDQAVSQRDLGA